MMDSFDHILRLISLSAGEIRQWLRANPEGSVDSDLGYLADQLAALSQTTSPDALQVLLDRIVDEETREDLIGNEITPSLFAAIRALDERKKKLKIQLGIHGVQQRR